MKNSRSWRRAIKDPVYFARAFLDFEPHPGQIRWLENSAGSENALVTGNRWGKSEIQAVKLLHRALFQDSPLASDVKDYYRCANVSITQDQAGIIFAKATALISRSRPLKAMVRSIKQTPFPHIEFKNGSEIWARSSYNRGEYLLGHDFDYINFDEAAYEPFGEWVVDGVIKLRLADRQGTLDFSSTPNGLNWFYKRCQMIAKENRGHLQHGSTFENPHLSEKYLTDLKGSLSESRAAQHLYGKFTSFEGRLFPEEIVQKCLVVNDDAVRFGDLTAPIAIFYPRLGPGAQGNIYCGDYNRCHRTAVSSYQSCAHAAGMAGDDQGNQRCTCAIRRDYDYRFYRVGRRGFIGAWGYWGDRF